MPRLAKKNKFMGRKVRKMKNFITKEQREKISNRVVLNFGALLCGALVMLYVYNFIIAGYSVSTVNLVGIVGIVSAVLAIVMFVLGLKKFPKIKNYSGIFLGMFIAALIVYASKFGFVTNLIPAYTAKVGVIVVFVLMAVYFIAFAVATAIYLKLHPEMPSEKKKIQHKKKKRK